jgi:serine protease
MISTTARVIAFSLLLGLQSLVFGQNIGLFTLPANAKEDDYLKNKVIVKVKSEYRSECSETAINDPELKKVFTQLGVSTLNKEFPRMKAPDKELNAQGQAYADLSLIYEVGFQSGVNIEKAVNLIQSTGKVEYAQPHYLPKPLDYNPADPLNFNQYHLGLIKAFKAWGIYKGDTNTVIGICDWGTDIDHPDLMGNIKYNNLDPIDGIDNDNDGYVDNYRGWNLGDNNNNPQEGIIHGAFVCGLSSAKTDNNTGLSGTGFLCKFLPVKVCDSNDLGTKTFEGIVYAVEHGCSIVNCSWGNTFNTGPFGQDVVDYATINKGALVIAACGNSNNLIPFYPASYNYVLSVAATNSADIKWSGSSYGYYVDIAAPGENVWSTIDGGTYGASGSGTSFAAPIVSGCAALLKSRYPYLSGLQVGERLKVSADVIDTLNLNSPYKGLIGSGRVNLYSALLDSLHPSVNFINPSITDANHDGSFFKYDTLIIKGGFINYLAPSSPGLIVTLSCLSHNALVIDSVVYLGVINTLQTVNNNSSPFKVYLKSGLAVNEDLIFKLTFSSTNYNTIQYFDLVVNPSFLNIDTNQIATTLTNDGMIGYYDGNSSLGIGFRYNNSETLLYNGGFLVGKSYTQVSDAIYGATGGYDHNFYPVRNLIKLSAPTTADFEAAGIFNDSLALSAKINVIVKQHAYAWTTSPNEKYIILGYTIINKNSFLVNNIYAGLYLDWDIGNSLRNRIGFDAANRLGYCYPIDGGTYTGVCLLSPGPIFHYGFDNNGDNGSIKVSAGFTSSEKYSALKTNRYDAGMFATGNDVSQMLSSGPYTLGTNDSIVLIYALIAGDQINDVQNSAALALQKFYATGISENGNNESDDVILFQNSPNPFSNQTNISFKLNSPQQIELSFTDLNGSNKEIIYQGKLDKGFHSYDIHKNLAAGIYFYSLSANNFFLKRKMCVIK